MALLPPMDIQYKFHTREKNLLAFSVVFKLFLKDLLAKVNLGSRCGRVKY